MTFDSATWIDLLGVFIHLVMKTIFIFSFYWLSTKGVRRLAFWINTDTRISKRPVHLWWVQMWSPKDKWKRTAKWACFLGSFVLM